MNELLSGMTAIPPITVLCLLGAQVFKSFVPGQKKHIPAICGLLGLLLGAICFFTAPGYLPAENPVTAAAIGAVSGWAATGIHQIKKQNTAPKTR